MTEVRVGRRLVGRSGADPGADRFCVRPDADREAGERRGAERGRLPLGGDLDRAAEQVGLELHQERVGARAAVGAQHADAAREGVEHVGDLERDRLERRPDEVGAVVPRVRPVTSPRASGSQCGEPRPVSAGTK